MDKKRVTEIKKKVSKKFPSFAKEDLEVCLEKMLEDRKITTKKLKNN